MRAREQLSREPTLQKHSRELPTRRVEKFRADFAGAGNAGGLLKRVSSNVARGIFIDTKQLKFYDGNARGNGNARNSVLFYPRPEIFPECGQLCADSRRP